MPIDRQRGPAEGAPFLAQGLQIQDFLSAAKALNPVVIDDRRQVVEVMMSREERRLPRGPLIALAVTQHGEHAIAWRCVDGGERHSARDGKSVSKRAG